MLCNGQIEGSSTKAGIEAASGPWMLMYNVRDGYSRNGNRCLLEQDKNSTGILKQSGKGR